MTTLLTDTAPRATHAAGFLQLPPTLIQEDPGQPRQEFPAEEQDALAESIAASGVKVPLLVRRQPDGTYQLTDGARRLRAALAVGAGVVPCVVSDDPGSLAVRQDQLLANAQRLDLTPLEDAQALYTVWLLHQIEALDAEQGDDGATTAQLLATGSPPTAQIQTLEARLCTLADVPTVAAYLGGGPKEVRVAWQTVLQAVGRGSWTADRRKKHLAVLHLDPGVQDSLAGLAISARTLREVAQLPPDAQRALVDQVTAGDGPSDVGAALRGALADRAGRDARGTPPGLDAVGAFDRDLDGADADDAAAAPVAGDFAGPLDVAADHRSTWTPDATLVMPFSTGPGKKLISDRGSVGRGSPPPPGHDRWTNDQALQASAGIEALQTVLDEVGPAYLTDEQIGWLRPMWRELVAGMERAGLHLDD
jgi:hypothetical protein